MNNQGNNCQSRSRLQFICCKTKESQTQYAQHRHTTLIACSTYTNRPHCKRNSHEPTVLHAQHTYTNHSHCTSLNVRTIFINQPHCTRSVHKPTLLHARLTQFALIACATYTNRPHCMHNPHAHQFAYHSRRSLNVSHYSQLGLPQMAKELASHL